jgi:hypothetical protein
MTMSEDFRELEETLRDYDLVDKREVADAIAMLRAERNMWEAKADVYKAERDAARAVTEWRDIATAPRDGTDILVCDARLDGGFQQVVFWDGETNGEWRWETSDGPTFHQEAFTHWRSLPLPPAPAIP